MIPFSTRGKSPIPAISFIFGGSSDFHRVARSESHESTNPVR